MDTLRPMYRCLILLCCVSPVAALAGSLETSIADLESCIPSEARLCTADCPDDVLQAARRVEDTAAGLAVLPAEVPLDQALATLRELLDAKRRVDCQIDAAFALRTQFAARHEQPTQRDEIRHYLRVTAQLIDLSGRLRYLLADAIQSVATRLAGSVVERTRLVELLIEYKSSIGATSVIGWLAEPGPGRRTLLRRNRDVGAEQLQSHVLRLVAVSGQSSLLPEVVQFIAREDVSTTALLDAVETIRAVGLPQDARPDTPADLPALATTATALRTRLAAVSDKNLTPNQARRRAALLAWLDERAKVGLSDPSYTIGSFDVQPGDWMLMRNPSPYNMFTDLAPGLFTHVGVVALETGTDGKRRMVLVDLPERGERVPATNIDVFVQRSLHYVFLRHTDGQVAAAMGEAAASMIGNPSEFDLNFRISRVVELRGQPLRGRKIKTYCAGFLLLCALQTTAPREDFFPIVEHSAPRHAEENMKLLGMTFEHEFISPTGALYSSRLLTVGHREPMYDPRREVEEAVFDHFAACMVDKQLVPAPDWYDTVRLHLAEASQTNPLLAQALAKANRVSADMDLVAAAKAATVIDTLDEIAFGASGEYLAAREALLAGSLDALRAQGASDEECALVSDYRQRHADLYGRHQAGQLSRRQLRIALVDYYRALGCRQLGERFFVDVDAPKNAAPTMR